MGKSIVIILLALSTVLLHAQDSLCVYKTKPGILLNDNGNKRPLSKGDYISAKSSIYMSSASEVMLINSQGEAFNIKNAGTYSYKNILKYKALDEQKSLTSKYFKLIWDELLKRNSNKTIIGGVFRGDVLIESPMDSTKSASSKITFRWKTEADASQYFIFIRAKNSETVYKFATNGNEFIVYKDNPIFSDNIEFEWSVSTSEFPSLKNIPFFTFTLIDRSEYEALKSSYSDLIKDLKAVGLTSTEIEDALCETYGICKN